MHLLPKMNLIVTKLLVAAVKKRKFLLERILEDRQHFPEDDGDEDNACVPYGLKNELNYHYR